MKRYWDFEERERAEMTMEQVESLLTAELMEAGVVRVESPVLLSVDPVEIPGTTLYGVKSGYYSLGGIGFRSPEDAATAVKLMVALDSSYIGGKDYKVINENSDAITIEPVAIHSRADLANHKSAVEKSAANKKANEAALVEYKKQTEAVDKVCDGVWDDWRDCQNTLADLRRVIRTLDDYTKTCDGDKSTAMKFLAKAFPAPQIQQAREWLDPDYVAEESAQPFAAVPALAVANTEF